jgi:hypothetical protein
MEQSGIPPARHAGPVILEATDGAWAEAPPPDLQPHFRCLVHPPGSILPPNRWSAPPRAPLPQPAPAEPADQSTDKGCDPEL